MCACGCVRPRGHEIDRWRKRLGCNLWCFLLPPFVILELGSKHIYLQSRPKVRHVEVVDRGLEKDFAEILNLMIAIKYKSYFDVVFVKRHVAQKLVLSCNNW